METLTDTRAYYTVRDQFNIAQSSYLNLNPNLNQMTNSTGGFSETLKFVETTPLQSGIRSNAYFNGEWEDLQDSESNSWGWDNNWNMYWAGYYSGTGSTAWVLLILQIQPIPILRLGLKIPLLLQATILEILKLKVLDNP